jgi:hypothetical protein
MPADLVVQRPTLAFGSESPNSRSQGRYADYTTRCLPGGDNTLRVTNDSEATKLLRSRIPH